MFKGFLKDDFFDFVNVGLNADELIFTVRIGTKSNRSAQFGSFQINDRLTHGFEVFEKPLHQRPALFERSSSPGRQCFISGINRTINVVDRAVRNFCEFL